MITINEFCMLWYAFDYSGKVTVYIEMESTSFYFAFLYDK